MTSFYRSWSALSVIIGINLAVSLFDVEVASDLILGNHLIEASAALAIIVFLVDLKMLNGEQQKNYLKIGIIALFAGGLMVLATFSSLFIPSTYTPIIGAWLATAPQIIFLIGIPSIYFADRLSQKNLFLKMSNVGVRGIINIIVVSIVYSVFMIYFLNKFGFLVI